MAERFISRGFVGRPRQAGADNRVPPGQHVVSDFPVLSAGPTPRTPLDRWTFTIEGLVSEPVTWTRSVNRCLVAGRFTIRQGAPADLARRFALPSPWTRASAWASWNAKGLVKPLLGSSYPRIADWIQSLILNH